MAEHAPDNSLSPFGIGTPYISNRESSVKAAIKLLIDQRVIVLRAPPFTGKSTLLSLIGNEILRNHEGLEPVMILWERRSTKEISKKPYYDLLDEELEVSRAWNDKARLNQNFTSLYYSGLFRGLNRITAQLTGLAKGEKNASRDPVYLIDDAVNTYSENLMWEKLFKNPDHTSKALFVLVCVHGSADGIVEWGSDLSQAAMIPLHRRIELHPYAPRRLCMLLSSLEIGEVVKIWAAGRVHPFQIGRDVIEYLEFETQGHAGMLQMVLRHLSNIADGIQMGRARRNSMQWDGALCRWFLHRNKDFLNSLTYTRGLWTETYERYVDKHLDIEKREKSQYQHLTFSDIKESLKRVASELGGYHADRPDPVLDFCHAIGLIHTEPKDSKTRYMFASCLHQRFAYSRLFRAPDPDAPVDR